MGYGERNRGELLAHNEVRLWAVEEHIKSNYLKARKIHKVAMKMRDRYWNHREKNKSG